MTARSPDRTLDPYLLRVFCLLVAERNVSRVAVRLNQSQPAISAALKTLREMFGDRLLVREKDGMVPTERALQLVEHARRALDEIDKLTGEAEAFSPIDSRQTFRVGAPEYLAPLFMASVSERFRREAPNASLIVESMGPSFDFEKALAEGALDIVIGNWPEPPERMRMSVLLEDEIVCMVSARHPAARRGLSERQYLAAVHVVPLPHSMSQRGLIDMHLAGMRVARDARIVVQSFYLAPFLLPGSDLVFTTTRHFARFYANLLPLTILASPIAFPPMRFYQLWHDRTQDSESHRWLRRLLAECGRNVQ